MMEEEQFNPVEFTLAQEDESSEDEDDIARKQELRQLLSQLPDDNLLDDPDCTVTSLDYDDHAYHHQVDDSGSIVGTTYGLIPESRAMVSESDFYPNTSQTYIPDTEGGVVGGVALEQGGLPDEGYSHGNYDNGLGNHDNHGNGHYDHIGADDDVFYDHQVVTPDFQDVAHETQNFLVASPKLGRPLPQPHALQLPQHQLDARPQPHAPQLPQHHTPQLDARPLPQHHAPQLDAQQGYSLKQLEVLYRARGRQVEELTQQLAAVKEDSERHIRILRQKAELLDAERVELSQHVASLQSDRGGAMEELLSVRGQLRAERTKSEVLETSKAGVMAQLVSAEATIHSLSQQVEELGSADTISRVRESYNSALSQASTQHKEDMALLQEEMGSIREELEAKDDTISRLNQELNELQNSQQLRAQPPGPVHRDTRPHHNVRPPQDQGVVQQLKFEAEGARLVELATQVEDIQFQVSTLTDELERTTGRAEIAETGQCEMAAKLSEAEGVNLLLHEQVAELQCQLKTLEQNTSAEKMAALEQCRLACLRLHDDSKRELQKTFLLEKEKITQDLTRQIIQARTDVATVQDEYVLVCQNKDRLAEELEKVKGEMERKLKEVELMWQDTLAQAVSQQAVKGGVEGVVKGVVEDVVRDGVEGVVKGEAEGVVKDGVEGVVKGPARGIDPLLSSSRPLSETQQVLESDTVCKLRQAHTEEVKGLRDQIARLEGEGAWQGRQEWAEEKDRCVEEAVKGARIQWLRERETSFQNRLDQAVSGALDLWKQTQGQEAPPPSQDLDANSTAVSAMLARAREKWETQYREEKEVTRKEFEKTLLSEREAWQKEREVWQQEREAWLKEEREAWQKEEKRGWEQRREELLLAAHRQWNATEEPLRRAGVERARMEGVEIARGEGVELARIEGMELVRREGVVLGRKEGVELGRKTIKSAVDLALSQARQRHEAALRALRAQLSSQHVRKENVLTQQIRQLEERLVECLREQDRKGSGGGGGGGRGMGEVQQLFQATLTSLKKDVTVFVKDMEERDRRSYEVKLQEIRQATAKEARAHYLQCLHQMVNSKKTTGSHDGSCEFSDGSCDFSDGSNDLPLELSGTTLGAVKPKGHAPSPKQPKAPPPLPRVDRLFEKTKNDRKIPKKETRRTATTKPCMGVSKFVPKTKLILHTESKSPSMKGVSPKGMTTRGVTTEGVATRGVATEGVTTRGVYWAKEPERIKSGRLRVPSGRVPPDHGHHQ